MVRLLMHYMKDFKDSIKHCVHKVGIYSKRKYVIYDIQHESIFLSKKISLLDITSDSIYKGVLTISLPTSVIGEINNIMLISE